MVQKKSKPKGHEAMRALVAGILLVLVLAISGCSLLRTNDSREVTRIVVLKEERRMMLVHKDKVLSKHKIDLGFAPVGHKRWQGDGRTPEGRYYVDRRNPNSKFHLSLGLSYPNARDAAEARADGKDPGGDIFIHGRGDPRKRRGADWTEGCISVSNREMELIYARVRIGTPVDIYP